MEDKLTDTYDVAGTLFVGNATYYALQIVALCDEQGNPMDGFGWLATSTTPINQDVLNLSEAEPVYDVPLFIMNAAYIKGLRDVPRKVECLKRFDWNDLLDVS